LNKPALPISPSLDRLVDTALDRAVVPGYSSIGYRVRCRSWSGDPPPAALAGADVLTTGANSGIGEAISLQAARLGARVHMLGRKRDRAEAARGRVVAALERAGQRNPSIGIELCDLSDLDSGRAFARDFADRVPSLHGLVHNAGVLTAQREHGAQGHELTLTTAVIAPFLLTRLLRGPLAAGTARVVFVSSGGMYTARLDLDDLELDQRDFDGPRFYAHAKRAQVVLASAFADHWRGTGVGFASMHPGWVDTPGLARSLPRFHRLTKPLLRDPSAGADTAVWLLATDAVARRPGAFWHDRRQRPVHLLPWTGDPSEAAARLWDQLVSITEDAG
jgi:NAD(P)-dependent dehydrogenase (short-subunit alcohol dehydrogenase family)